jgi:hypothetical protein
MFSWSDLLSLQCLNNNLAPHNQGMASFLLVCQDDNNVFQTYAMVIDPQSLNSSIDNFMTNPENIGCSYGEIAQNMDAMLWQEFTNDSNFERVFLRYISNLNISIYKADNELTTWSKLTLSNNSPTATVNSIKCN